VSSAEYQNPQKLSETFVQCTTNYFLFRKLLEEIFFPYLLCAHLDKQSMSKQMNAGSEGEYININSNNKTSSSETSTTRFY
jgi:hypothetical protein